MSTGYVISLKFILYAKPEQVFKTLTEPALIEKWSNAKGELQPKKDGKFTWFDDWAVGTVITAVPNESITFTWKSGEWAKNIKDSMVSIQLSGHKAGTEILLNHANLPSAEELKKHKNGWIDYVLDPLNDYFSMQLTTN